MRRLSYTKPAKVDLEKINVYQRREADARIAAGQLELIRTTANRLVDYPRSGPSIEDGPFRSITARGTPFLIVYRLIAEDVQIVRVFHGAQDWPSALT